MRWVKLSLPPRVRVRWLLAILRLTSSNLAGTGRTDVAVGTVRLAAMLRAIDDAAPRIGSPGNARGASATTAASPPFPETGSEGIAAATGPGDEAGGGEGGADGAAAEVKRSIEAEAPSAPPPAEGAPFVSSGASAPCL